MMGKLSIVPTPLGNLGDMTQRALDVLDDADVICAEDTRVTGKLLAHFGIHAHLERCDENIIARRSATLVERMANGEHIAFCSDAGMPGISDPGSVLVDAARDAGVPVDVLPGPSAVVTALVAAGFGASAFYFGGFMPRKDGERSRLLESLRPLDAALVFYESPHRVASAVEAIARSLDGRRVALCRELTKLHEEVLRLPADELAQNLRERDSIKGEIVLVIAPPLVTGQMVDLCDPVLHDRIECQLASGMSKSALAKQLASDLGVSKNQLYDLILEVSKDK
jgi:16S rRNA (cytidine1402-2'-O)-methyltransferase